MRKINDFSRVWETYDAMSYNHALPVECDNRKQAHNLIVVARRRGIQVRTHASFMVYLLKGEVRETKDPKIVRRDDDRRKY